MEAAVRKILLATIWALGMGLAIATLPAATWIVGYAPSAAAAGIDTASAYSHADVLEPGTRGSVVEI
jgi:hypothetical protein